MKKTKNLCVAVALIWLLQSCDKPFSIAMHSPISPAPGGNVTYSLEMLNGSAPKKVELFEQVIQLTPVTIQLPFGLSFTILQQSPQSEILLNTWNNPAIGTLSFPRASGIPANSLIKYRFAIRQSNNVLIEHSVSFAGRDYPSPDNPIPVYVTGDPDNSFDIVMIPDSDITDMNNFRTHVRGMIRDAFFDEKTTKIFRHSYNFYINRQTGHATDYDRIATDGYHQLPSNNAFITFAEGRALLHQGSLRDYATGGLFSSEMQNRGTMLHESGHSLFALKDEYQGGAHAQAAQLPNNWSTLAGAQSDAPGRGKNSEDAVKIGTDSWYKICAGSCQMNNSGESHVSYDRPCADRIIYSVFNIGN